MQISLNDVVNFVPPETKPNYGDNNPLLKLIRIHETLQLAAEREHYAYDQIQVLYPIESLELYGPADPDHQVLDPAQQDSREDFQKQNIQDFVLGDTVISRGWATVDDWTGAFLRISYRAGPDSKLSQAAGHTLNESIRLYLKVGDNDTTDLIVVPYNTISDRYEVEFWAYPGDDLRSKLDTLGRAAWDRGELQIRMDLVHGAAEPFRREEVSDHQIPNVDPSHTMHPTNPLRIEFAWGDHSLQFWDSRGGQNYVYEFSMVIRGWNNYLKVGTSSNPHGGIGKLEFRTLLSNYGDFVNSDELGRKPAAFSFDAFGLKSHNGRREPFLAVDYMDLHIVEPNGGIGIHRHRDNQEVFMVLQNEVVMIVGDWCEFPHRQRAFEVRTLSAGHFALLKSGQLHGLLNPTDEDISLLMFGGYD